MLPITLFYGHAFGQKLGTTKNFLCFLCLHFLIIATFPHPVYCFRQLCLSTLKIPKYCYKAAIYLRAVLLTQFNLEILLIAESNVEKLSKVKKNIAFAEKACHFDCILLLFCFPLCSNCAILICVKCHLLRLIEIFIMR